MAKKIHFAVGFALLGLMALAISCASTKSSPGNARFRAGLAASAG